MSPLAWDLGHVAAFEDLWVSREAGLELLREDLADVYDAFETPAPAGADLELTFADGEEIRTEISAKFTRDAVERELHGAVVALDDFFTDGAGLFGLAFASPR
jgi:iron(II)-dependent oxidoreductase